MEPVNIKQLAKWSVIAIIIAVMPIIAFNIANIYSSLACQGSLNEFEAKLSDEITSAKTGTLSEIKLESPCNIDTAYIIDEKASTEKFEGYPLIISSLISSSGEKQNIFLIENKKIKHSFSIGKASMASPHYLCIDLSEKSAELSLEKSEENTIIKHKDAKHNCGPIEVRQLPISAQLKLEASKKEDEIGAIMQDSIDGLHTSTMSSSDITREITCSKNGSSVEITLKAKEGKRIKNPAYLEFIPQDCLKEIKEKQITLTDAEIKHSSFENNAKIFRREEPIIFWLLNTSEISSEPVTLAYSADKCIKKCSTLIEGMLIAEKVFDLDIQNEISELELKLGSTKFLEPVKSAVTKGSFNQAIAETQKLIDSAKDKETKELLKELLDEINGMRIDSEKGNT